MAEVKEKRPSVKAEERHAESFISGISHRSMWRFNVNETLLTDFSFSTFNIQSSVETEFRSFQTIQYQFQLKLQAKSNTFFQ